MSNVVLAIKNISQIMEQGFIDWALEAYTVLFGVWVWPLIFIGIIGYVYAVNKSATSAAVAICLIFGIFGITGIFADVGEFSQFSSLIALFSIAGGFVALFLNKNR